MLRRGEMEIELKIHLAFDDEASVWYVAQSDIPGLRLEADDPADLVRRIEECAPEMLALNRSEILRAHRNRLEEKSVKLVFDSPVRLGGALPAC